MIKQGSIMDLRSLTTEMRDRGIDPPVGGVLREKTGRWPASIMSACARRRDLRAFRLRYVNPICSSPISKEHPRSEKAIGVYCVVPGQSSANRRRGGVLAFTDGEVQSHEHEVVGHHKPLIPVSTTECSNISGVLTHTNAAMVAML